MKMRIRELADLSGQPKTTIHYYQREGLLPPPHKTSRNTALYGEEHLRRLSVISQLRHAGLPTAHLKRAIDLVEQGVAVETALELQKALASKRAGPVFSLEQLADEAHLSVSDVQQFLHAGLLGPAERSKFQRDDVAAVTAVAAMRRQGVGLGFLQQAIGLLNELTRLEFTLADQLTGELLQAERSQSLLELQKSVDCLHPYWLTQARKQQVFQRWPSGVQQLIKEHEL